MKMMGQVLFRQTSLMKLSTNLDCNVASAPATTESISKWSLDPSKPSSSTRPAGCPHVSRKTDAIGNCCGCTRLTSHATRSPCRIRSEFQASDKGLDSRRNASLSRSSLRARFLSRITLHFSAHLRLDPTKSVLPCSCFIRALGRRPTASDSDCPGAKPTSKFARVEGGRVG